ncbi:MAG: hypothetical protein WC989_04480 [Micavibrio sp.]
MAKGTAFQEGSKLFSRLWDFAFSKKPATGGPTLSGTTGKLSRSERNALVREGREAGIETRNISRNGLFRRPTADIGDIKESAALKIKELAGESLSKAEIAGLAAKAAKQAEKGGFGKRALVGVGKTGLMATKASPLVGMGAIGVAGYAGYSAISNTFNGLANGELPSMNGPLTGMFKTATNGLEYLGVNPMLASGLTAIAAFTATKSLINAALSVSGLDKMLPSGLTNLATTLAVGAFVLTTAMSAYEGNNPEAAPATPSNNKIPEMALTPSF